jgi:CarboxypepD_reg-like domain
MIRRQNIVRWLVFTVICPFSLMLNAQLNYDFTQGKFLIKGKVVDLRTQTPVAFTNIKIYPSGKGLTCDNEGNFTMYVSKKDTLVFSSTGYIAKTFHVVDFDSTKYYTLQIELLHDFIKLKEVVIYPFKDMDDFKKAFVDAKDQLKVNIPGIAPPKYSNKIPKAKFSNPISFLYERLKHHSVANPDFKP